MAKTAKSKIKKLPAALGNFFAARNGGGDLLAPAQHA
jgi:hypothetical protein